MTHKEKLNKMFKDLPQKGIGKYTLAPPAYRLLWKMNIKIPPPYFASFIFLFISQGAFFGIFWGLFMWLLLWRQQKLPAIIILLASVFAGILFGLCMGGYYRSQARKHNLLLWKNYGTEE